MAIVRSPRARIDVVEIALHIAQTNPSAAERWIDSLQTKFALLDSHPELGEARPEIATGLRAHSAGNYVIYYLPVLHGIEIVRVLHGARDVRHLF